MPYRPYGPPGLTWSSDSPEPWGPSNPALRLAVAGGLGLGVAAALVKPGYGGAGASRAIDNLQKTIRNAAALVPFEAGNTFRAAEWLSPFVSPSGQGLPFEKSVAGIHQVGVYNIPHQFINDPTRSLLKAAVGEDAFVKAGLEASSKFELRFERDPNKVTRGSLFARHLQLEGGKLIPKTGPGQGWNLVSDAVALFEQTSAQGIIPRAGEALPTAATLRHPAPDMNLVGKAIYGHMGVTEQVGAGAVGRILTDVSPDGQVLSRLQLGLMPSASGPLKSWGDASRRLTHLGGFASFEMNRFRRLLEATAEQVPLLGKVGGGLAKATGLGLGITQGPAHKMFAKFGLQAGKVGGAYMLLQQLDWARRQFSVPGEIMASGAVSAIGTHLLNKSKVFKSPKTAMMVGVASFFGQLVLPGFDQGVIEGLSSTWAGAKVLGAYAGEVTGMSAYRRVIEGFTGMTEPGWGVAAGLGVVAASYKFNKSLFGQELLTGDLGKRIGFDPSVMKPGVGPMGSLNEYYFRQLGEAAISPKAMAHAPAGITGTLPWNVSEDKLAGMFGGADPAKWEYSKKNLRRLRGAMGESVLSYMGSTPNTAQSSKVSGWFLDERHQRHLEAQAIRHHDYMENNPLTQSLSKRMDNIQQKYRGSVGGAPPRGLDRALEFAEIQATKTWHGFFGAPLAGKEMKTLTGTKGGLGRIGSLFGAGFLAQQILSGGLLGTLESPGELRDIYAGRKMVPIRKGRFWEAGGAPYGGAEDVYYRPGRHALMMSRAEQRALWGPDEDSISPIGKFFRENFTYQMEQQTYYDRPYPISGAGLQNVPIIGNILAATVGGLVKPAKLMHTNEWMRSTPSGEIEYAHRPEINGPAMQLGGKALGAPGSPFASSFVAAESQYQFRELAGLTGWVKNMFQLAITGSETFGTRTPVMTSAREMNSPIQRFWDLNLGGALFTSEPIRRFLPRPRAEIDQYNPLINRMPSWVPERLHYGDPYRALASGYARLPGAGYEALHPEIQGVAPENYPLIHQYAILGDIAPTSRSFSEVQQQLYDRRAQSITSKAENAWMDTIDEQVANVAVKRPIESLVNAHAVQLPGSSITQAIVGTALDVSRDMAAPLEYLSPMGFRPFQKLLPYSNQIDQYEYERLYGTMNAFWNKPWRDWFRPAVHSAAHMMGWEGKPAWRKEADEISEHFDKVEFEKWMHLAQAAPSSAERRSYLRQAQGTRYGVNPSGDAMSVYRTMPASEKKFFDAFSFASATDRDRILEMVPRDHAELYQNLWRRMDMGDQTLYPGSNTQLNEANLMTRFYDLDNQLADQPRPSPDWIGWHQDVDIDDVKLKYVNNLGKDIHEFDMWHKQQRSLARKPYLEGADGFMFRGPGPGRGEIHNSLYRLNMGDFSPQQPAEWYVHNNPSNMGSSAHFYYNDNREVTIRSMMDALQ